MSLAMAPAYAAGHARSRRRGTEVHRIQRLLEPGAAGTHSARVVPHSTRTWSVLQAKGLILVHAEPEERVARWPLADTPVELAVVANKPILVHRSRPSPPPGSSRWASSGSPAIAPRLRAVVGEASAGGVRMTHIAPSAPLTILESLLVAEDFVSGDPFVVELAGHLVRHDVAGAISQLGDGYDAVVVGEPVRPSPRRERLLPWDGPGGGTTTVIPPVAGLARVDVMALSPEVFPTVHELTAAGPPSTASPSHPATPVEWTGPHGAGGRLGPSHPRRGGSRGRQPADAGRPGRRLRRGSPLRRDRHAPWRSIRPPPCKSSILRGPSTTRPPCGAHRRVHRRDTSIGEGVSVEGTELEKLRDPPRSRFEAPRHPAGGERASEKMQGSRGAMGFRGQCD